MTCASPNRNPTAHLQMNWQITFRSRRLVDSNPKLVKFLQLIHKRKMNKTNQRRLRTLARAIAHISTNLSPTFLLCITLLITPSLVVTTQ